MKNVSKLSLADLISGLNYLEDFDKEIDKFLINSENLNKQGEELFPKSTINEMIKMLNVIREKKLLFRNELDKRLFTKDEIRQQENIKKAGEVTDDYNKCMALKSENSELKNDEIFEKIAAQKGKSKATVDSNYYYYINNILKKK